MVEVEKSAPSNPRRDKIAAYAEALYEDSRLKSAKQLQDARVDYVRKSSITNAYLPVSGTMARHVIGLYVEHIERCLESKFSAYKRAYDEAKLEPSEGELDDIWEKVKAVLALETSHSARAVQEFLKARGSQSDPHESLRAETAHAHDRILRQWKIWKQKVRLSSDSSTRTAETEKNLKKDEPFNICNKAQFEEDLAVWSTKAASDNQPLGLVLADVDFFKQFNDEYDYAVGDKVLRAIADALNKIADCRGRAYRWGGDEFTVLLQNADLAEAEATANRVLDLIRSIKIAECGRQVTASVGFASFPSSTSDAAGPFGAANASVKDAKQGGRNRVGANSTAPQAGSHKNPEVKKPFISPWITLVLGQRGYYRIQVDNDSDHEIVIAQIQMKTNDGIILTKPTTPKPDESWVVRPKSTAQIGFYPSPNPADALIRMDSIQGIFARFTIEILLTGKVDGKDTTISQSKMVQVNATTRDMTQLT